MKRTPVFILLLLFFFLVPGVAFAQNEACNPGEILPPCTCSGDCQLTDFIQLFINLYGFGVKIAAPLGIFFIIIGAVILVTATGYANRIEMGKTMITQAVTGLIIVLISWVIVDTAIYLLTNNRDQMVFNRKWYAGFTYVCKDENLQQGCSGGNVSDLQRKLVDMGYAIEVDGSYGPQTASAVRQYQRDANSAYVPNAVLACNGKPGGIDVWNEAFDLDCNPPVGTCGVDPAIAEEKQLSESGSADLETQRSLDDLLKVSGQFTAACLTS